MTKDDRSELLALADKLDAHAVRYANDYGYNVATDLKVAAATLRAAPVPKCEAEPVRNGDTVTVIVPDGYDSVWDFLNDCGLEAIAAPPSRSDAEVREIIEQCAKIADKEADLLIFTGARLNSFNQATQLHYSEAELHDQAGTAIRVVADKIRALSTE